MRNEPPTLPDGRDGPFARELGWTDPEPPLLVGSYPDSYQATQRDDCDLARFGRVFWSECAAAYHHVRPAGFKNVAARFRKGKDAHLGACLELFTARLLPLLRVPLTAPDTTVHDPEFVTVLGSTTTLIECQVTTALDETVARGNEVTTQILNSIRGFDFGGLYVSVKVTGTTTENPPMKDLRRRFDQWRASLNLPQSPCPRLDGVALPPLSIPLGDGAFVSLCPFSFVGAQERGGVACIDACPVSCQALVEKLRGNIRAKAKKYGDHPLLLVVGASSSYADVEDLLSACFGPMRRTVGLCHSTGEIVFQTATRGIDGALLHHGPKCTNVVGVLLVSGHIGMPWESTVTLVPNPSTRFRDALGGLEWILASMLGPGDIDSWTAKQIDGELNVAQLMDVPTVARVMRQRFTIPAA